MKTLTKEVFEALRYAYNQGSIDLVDQADNFDQVIDFWFSLEEEETDEQ